MTLTHSPKKPENPFKRSRNEIDTSGNQLNMDTVEEPQPPQPTGDLMMDKLNLILFNQTNGKLENRIDALEERMTERFNENGTTLEEIRQDVNDGNDRIVAVEMRMDAQDETTNSLQDQITQLQKQLLNVEKEQKRNNILVIGVPEIPGDETKQMLTATVNKIIVELLKTTEITPEDIFRIGVRGSRARPIKILLKSCQDKYKIFAHTKNLKGTNCNISFKNDLPTQLQEEQHLLLVKRRSALDNNHKVELRGQILTIDGVKWHVKNKEVVLMETMDA